MAPLTHRQHIFLRLAIVPVAALVASHVVFSQVFPGQPEYQFPWAYFLTVATVMLSCWEVNLFIFRWLDVRLPFWQNPIRRLMAQILMGGTATLLTFAIVFPLAQRIYIHHWPATPTVLKGVAVCIALASLVNGGYSGLYLLQAFLSERRQKDLSISTEDTLRQPAESDTSLPFLVSVDVSTGQLRLSVDEIAYFYSTGGLVLLIKTDGQQITTRYASFAQLMERFDSRYFFQLSRQFLISLGAVRAVKGDVNRKLVVPLQPALHKQQLTQEVVVSRYRSPEFKHWLHTSIAH